MFNSLKISVEKLVARIMYLLELLRKPPRLRIVYILHSVHYSTVIKIQTNKSTQF